MSRCCCRSDARRRSCAIEAPRPSARLPLPPANGTAPPTDRQVGARSIEQSSAYDHGDSARIVCLEQRLEHAASMARMRAIHEPSDSDRVAPRIPVKSTKSVLNLSAGGADCRSGLEIWMSAVGGRRGVE